VLCTHFAVVCIVVLHLLVPPVRAVTLACYIDDACASVTLVAAVCGSGNILTVCC
jgi:hypothetical protein